MDNKAINNNNIFNKNPFALLDLESIPVGLRESHKLLISKNWKNRINNEDILVYSKDDEIFDEFRIKVSDNNIQVSVPLPNSEFLYKCKFNNYFDAYDFIVQHLHNYEISKKTQSLFEDIKKKKDNSLNTYLESN
jgi:hypothetical protein